MKKRPSKPKPPWRVLDPLDRPLSIAKLFILVAGGGLGLFLVSFQIHKISAGPLIVQMDRVFIVEVAFIVYLNAWIWAQPIEMGITRKVYQTDPNKGRPPISLMILLPTLVACAAILFLARHNDKHLSWALTAFFAIDFGLWWNMSLLAKKYQAANEKVYQEGDDKYWRIEQLRFYAQTYLQGSWQFVRFSVLFVILVLFVIVANAPGLTQKMASLAQPLMQDNTTDHIAVLIPSVIFLLYVLVCESWVWVMRLRAYHAISVIDYLAPIYELHPRNDPRGET
jgi:hypothetical protein